MSEIYGAIFSQNFIAHHGIKGQRWGIRRTPEQLGHHKNSFNLEKWGKSQNKNVLYLTGISGSGKSTLAKRITKNDKNSLIQLDIYFDGQGRNKFYINDHSNKVYMQRNPLFDDFLKKNHPEIFKGMNSWQNNARINKAHLFDDFQKAINEFGSQQYGKRKIVCEGLQIATAFDHKKLKGKPLIALESGLTKSYYRNIKREFETDNVENINKLFSLLKSTTNNTIKYGIRNKKETKRLVKYLKKGGS